MKTLLLEIRSALLATVVLAFVCGGVYPLIVFGIAQTAFPDRANGSLILDPDGTVRGSALLAQPFTGPGYFHPRPSAAGANGYDAAASGGSNLGPTSRALRDAIRERVTRFRESNGLGPTESVPADAVTASGSGLDPHISPGNAAIQSRRVARVRGLSEREVREWVRRHTESPWRGIGWGDPRVDVLTLNRALDRLRAVPSSATGATND